MTKAKLYTSILAYFNKHFFLCSWLNFAQLNITFIELFVYDFHKILWKLLISISGCFRLKNKVHRNALKDILYFVLLTELYESVIVSNRIENSERRMLKLKKLIHELPEHNYETLRHLAEHLANVAAKEKINKVWNVDDYVGDTAIDICDTDVVIYDTDVDICDIAIDICDTDIDICDWY